MCDIRVKNVLSVFALFMTFIKKAYHTLRRNKWKPILKVWHRIISCSDILVCVQLMFRKSGHKTILLTVVLNYGFFLPLIKIGCTKYSPLPSNELHSMSGPLIQYAYERNRFLTKLILGNVKLHLYEPKPFVPYVRGAKCLYWF